MFTTYTWQDWQEKGFDKVESGDSAAQAKKLEFILSIIRSYKATDEFRRALEANSYFDGTNPLVMKKVILRGEAAEVEVELDNGSKKKTLTTRNKELVGNRIPSKFFFRFVTQQNQYLLGNGVTLEDVDDKERLGFGFDKALQQIGEKALVHGTGWGFWNYDHLEAINAAADGMSGFVALVDEMTQEPKVGIQFWQIHSKKPMGVRLFELDGVSSYKTNSGRLVEVEAKRPYVIQSVSDGLGIVEQTGENYERLPVVPLYANDDKQSELSVSIKNKIDLYDRILSDFGDNLDRTNDVYWVLNNYGGSTKEIAGMLQMIEKLRVVINQDNGGTASTAEPRTFEVPYQARATAMELLRKELYSDYMALDMRELTGGSLTNVAIEAAMTNLNLKADRYEWQCFQFVQRILEMAGIESEKIVFKRNTMANKSEIVDDIYKAREDLDRRTRLKLNPYVMQEEIDDIDAAVEMEAVPKIASPDELEAMLTSMRGSEA